MKIIHRSETQPIQDTCGNVQELFDSENLSISIATITGKSEPHKHRIMEEVYVILHGEGIMYIDGECESIQQGDVIPIPKGKMHYVESKEGTSIEILVVTNPRFNKIDVIK